MGNSNDTTVASIRFGRKLLELVDSVAQKRGTDRSAFIRECVLVRLVNLDYLKDADKKALGDIKPGNDKNEPNRQISG